MTEASLVIPPALVASMSVPTTKSSRRLAQTLWTSGCLVMGVVAQAISNVWIGHGPG